MRHFRVSITTKLLGLFLAVGIITLLIVGIYSFYSARQAIIDRTIDQLIFVRAMKKQQVEDFFSERINNLYSILDEKSVASLAEFSSENSGSRAGEPSGIEDLRHDFLLYGFTRLYYRGDDLSPVVSVDSMTTGRLPAGLDEFGLVTALRNLIDETAILSGIEMEFDAEIEAVPDGFHAVYLFRIVQEAIQNILKHAAARLISVQLLETRDSILLIIEDDGKGFDTGKVQGGNGIVNMVERARLMGGVLTIESAPGSGTTVRVKIPKTNERENQDHNRG